VALKDEGEGEVVIVVIVDIVVRVVRVVIV